MFDGGFHFHSSNIDDHRQRLLLRDTRLAVDDMRMRVEFVERRDPFVEGVDTSTTFLVPPLIAAPNFPLDLVVRPFNVFLEDKGLAEVEQLCLAARCLRIPRDAFVFFYWKKGKEIVVSLSSLR